MGRPKGSKNKKTLEREKQELANKQGLLNNGPKTTENTTLVPPVVSYTDLTATPASND